MSKFADDFDHKYAKQFQLYIEIFVSIQRGSLNQARKSIAQWEVLLKIEPDVQSLGFLGWKAEALVLLKDYEGVEKSFDQIEWVRKKSSMVPPTIESLYLYPRALYDILLLEESICSNNKATIFEFKSRAGNSSKRLLLNANKSARIRTRALRLLGQYYWLISKQSKAVKFWKKSILAGKELVQRPDLARTYMEIGKRFLEEKSKYKELNGITASEYLQKARTMFQEIDLQWDLDELDKITSDV